MAPKILTVDDSRIIHSIIKKTLSGYQCEILTANNGVEGLNAIEEERPALVILDIDMPGMNGLEMLMRLRNSNDLMDTPVIILTSRANTANIRMAKELAIDAFIAKPFNRDFFIQKVSGVVELLRK